MHRGRGPGAHNTFYLNNKNKKKLLKGWRLLCWLQREGKHKNSSHMKDRTHVRWSHQNKRDRNIHRATFWQPRGERHSARSIQHLVGFGVYVLTAERISSAQSRLENRRSVKSPSSISQTEKWFSYLWFTPFWLLIVSRFKYSNLSDKYLMKTYF